jgi:hypothetical protein
MKYSIFIGTLLLFLVCSFYFFQRWYFSKNTTAIPYKSDEEMVSEIKQLPMIGVNSAETTSYQWRSYTLIAKRMKVTNTNTIMTALNRVADDKQANLYNDIKLMILLRVCFKIPSGRFPGYIHGGWVSDSAMHENKIIQDENWPVGRRLGHYYLEDTISGYQGPPYDPVMDFQWRLENGEWRDL